MRPVAILAAVAAGLLLLTAAVAHAQATTSTVEVVELGPMPREVRESSGLAVSRVHGVFWTHNDSGDRPRLYALDSTAALVSVSDVRGVRARDWEALDIGPCPGGEPTWCLYIADTGDNERRRRSVELHVVPEPHPWASAPLSADVAGSRGEPPVPTRSAVSPLVSVRFAYQGGPFDVEAVAASPAGDIVLVTKGREPGVHAFTIPASEVRRVAARPEPLLLRDPVSPRIPRGHLVTGASVHPDGGVVAIRSYLAVFFFAWPLTPEPQQTAPPCPIGRPQPGGEAVAFGADGRLYLSSESPGPLVGHLLRIECPGIGS